MACDILQRRQRYTDAFTERQENQSSYIRPFSFQFLFERILWLFILTLILATMQNHLVSVWKSHSDSARITTSIGLRAEKEVPFPALTINVGRPVDPLGFVRRSKTMVSATEVNEDGKINV